MSDRTIPCPGCDRKFASAHALQQHKRAQGHGKRRLARVAAAATMSPGDAYDFVDALDLPDGAHWAMLEELTGLEPADFI